MYGFGNNQVNALDGIDLTVSKGEFVAIIGVSSLGKSTLLHILGSMDKPTSGKVIIDGTDLSNTESDTGSNLLQKKSDFDVSVL